MPRWRRSLVSFKTAPTTLAGLQAWAAYLDELSSGTEGWLFEDSAQTLVVTLVEALRNLQVAPKGAERSAPSN